MPYGATPTGPVPKTEADILAELLDALDARLGVAVDRRPESTLVRMLGPFARRLAAGWAVAESLYQGSDPGLAAGLALDDLVAAVGLRRLGAQPSWVDVLCVGKAGTKLTAGRVASADGARFVSSEDAVLTATWGRVLTVLEVEPGARYELTADGITASAVAVAGQTPEELARALGEAASATHAGLLVHVSGDRIEILSRDPSLTPNLSARVELYRALKVTLNQVQALSSQTLSVSGQGLVTASTVASDPPVFGTVLANLAGQLSGASWLGVRLGSDGRSLEVRATALGIALSAWGSPMAAVVDITTNQSKLFKLEELKKGSAIVRFRSEDTGPVPASRDALCRIETPVSGWERLANALSADLGRDAELDSGVRARLTRSRQILGVGVSGAIEARIRQDIPGVRSALVVENHDDLADAAGRPPHSFELVVDAMVDPDTDLAIGRLLESLRPAGIGACSTAAASGRVEARWLDDRGAERVIVFSRPTRVPVMLSVKLHPHPDEVFPEGAAEVLLSRLLLWGARHGVGQDVVIGRLLPVLHTFPGVAEVEFLVAGRVAGTSPANIPIGPLEIASFEAADGALITLIPPS